MSPGRSGSELKRGGGERDVLVLLERVNRVMLAAPSLEALLADVLDEMLVAFECHRAWLLYPCAPDADGFTVPMERTVPEWPGAGATSERVPMEPFARRAMASGLEQPGAHCWDGVHETLPDVPLVRHFSIQSMMFMAIHPRTGAPWCLGIHHCAAPRVYDDKDTALLEAIGARLADGLTGLLALQESQADRRRLEAAQEIAQVGSHEWQRHGGAYWSRKLLALLGADAEGARPLESVLARVHGEDRARVSALVASVLEGGGEYEFQARATRPNGQPWVMLAKGRATLGADGRVASVFGVVQDVTERVHAEERRRELEDHLRESQKMESIGQLTGGVAHDFNNLLTVILGSLSELPEAIAKQSDAVTELLDHARSAAERAAELTRMLTAFSRRQPLRPRSTDVNALLHKFEQLLRRTLGATIEIETVRGAGLWRCEVDTAQLESALLNLALNARDAMPSGGKLTIETANARLDAEYARQHDEVAPGQYVLVAVTDNGSGMAADTLHRAFEPFFTTKPPGRGTGLGLSMVYGFIKQSGGHVKLYSEPGQGTVCRIYLPRSTNPIVESPAPVGDGTPSPAQGELVLVVDDDPQVRAVTVLMLDHLGYRVLEAHDGHSALALLAASPEVALLLTDVVLPGGMAGTELAQQATARRPDLPILFMSGYTENAVIHQGRLDPGVRLVEKPFTRAVLALHLRAALAARR